MQGYLAGVSEGTRVLLILSVILFAGFIMTRLTNTLNLPKVSGYIMAGILIGPCGLNLIPVEIIGHMGFVSDLALAFIAFGVGKFFKKEVLLKTGSRIIIITLFEALLAGVLVTLFCVGVFKMEWNFALILGAIATATAPASTMMTINQYKAKGEFVNTLLQIVALDDVVCLLAFSIVAGIAGRTGNEELTMSTVLMPVVYNILALGLGFFCGYFLSRLLIPARSKDNRLILAIAMLLGISGICASLDISPLLSCMIFGASYINLTSDKKLYRQINNFTPPVMSIFFIMSGINLDLSALTTVGHGGSGILYRENYRKVSGNVYQLSDYGNQQGNSKLYGPGSDPAGRCCHRSGVSGTEGASRGDGETASDHYSLFFRPLRDGRAGLRQDVPVPLRQHYHGENEGSGKGEGGGDSRGEPDCIGK